MQCVVEERELESNLKEQALKPKLNIKCETPAATLR